MKMDEKMLQKILLAMLILAVGLFSFLFIADKAQSPLTHQELASSIDEKVHTVLKLTGAATLASAGLSAMPGDLATPIADKLADFSGYFLIVLCALYAEKYLMSIIGLAVFKVLIPAGCVLLILRIFTDRKPLSQLAGRMIFLGLALYIAIPASVKASDLITDTYQASISQTIEDAENISEEASELEGQEEQGILEGLVNRLTSRASELSERAANILNRFIEVLAVMLVTSCLIPILVLVFFAWLIKIFLGLDIPDFSRRHLHNNHKSNKNEEQD